MFRLYAMVAVVLFVVGAAGVSTINRATNYTPAKASVFLIDPAGRLRVMAPFGTPVDDVVHDIRVLLEE